MKKLQEKDRENAKWVIRHYLEINEMVLRVERKRPRLIARLVIDQTTGLPLPPDKQNATKHVSDKPVIISYITGCEILDIVETAMGERLKAGDAKLMRDVCMNGMSVTSTAEKHCVSEKTVKRARIKLEKAYIDELNARKVRK